MMNLKRFFLFLLLLISVIVFPGVQLKSDVSLPPGVLKLRDVLVDHKGISGDLLEKPIIFLIPGLTYRMNRDFFERKFPNLDFEGSCVTITVNASPLDFGEVLKEKIEDHLGLKDDFQFFVERSYGFPEDLKNFSIRITKISQSRLSVFIKFQGKRISYVTLQLRLVSLRKVVVAARRINYGEIISKEDLEYARVNVFDVTGTYMENLEECVGKKARKMFNEGEVILQEFLEKTPDVVRGQIILAYVEFPGIKVMSLVRSMENGWIGETIAARNLETGRLVYGILEEGPFLRVLEVTR
ncbi:MAG TPA: flagellar basal body P-ring formation protein FlgA [Thermotoga sp.]|nr:MAG: flagella basal body P-ring formation protein FlgA [Thermotogota bacterium]RKX56660.1 MAG: flagella basal body P-ring formation protein FlgA [Thermotoga sp.]HDG62070.1 flagellar basal body P-ring formation protein FlgA [Thermotoga sp.]